MKAVVKKSLKNNVIRSPFLRRILSGITSHVPRVFLYHRFTASDQQHPHRVSRDSFAAQLERVQAEFDIISFAELLDYYNAHGIWPKRTAVITIDDGYRDFYEHAFPELKQRGLTATFFVTVNFIDQKIWLWPDRLEYALQQTNEKHLTITLHGKQQTFATGSLEQRQCTWKTLSDYCISVADEERCRVMTAVENATHVSLPEVPPGEYAAVSWPEILELADAGIEIGSHTMNHPILSRIDSDRLHHEVARSKEVLEEKIGRKIRTFCYPNSCPGDINEAVITTVRNAGYSGSPFWRNLLHFDPFGVPRMGVTNDLNDFLAKLAGLEYLGQKIRKK